MSYPKSDHYDGKRFLNPHQPERRKFRDVFKFLVTSSRQPWPKEVMNEPQVTAAGALAEDQVAVTFINHATVLVQTRKLNVLTDPVYSERVSPLSWIGPKRVRQPGVPFDELPKIDVVLISHNHYDHLDLATLRRLKEKSDPQFFVPLGNKSLLLKSGIERVVELDWWASLKVAGTTEITLTPAQHFSGRGLFDRDKTLWGGYFIDSSDVRVFFAGDAAYSPHFEEVRSRLGKPDVALLPIGAYEPRWFMRVVHMNPEEAVLAHRDLGAKRSVAIHFGTFQLTDEAIDQPVKDLEAARIQYHLLTDAFVVLKEGQAEIFSGAITRSG